MPTENYLFSFGFENPHEARSNYLHGTDFESSRCLWVAAKDEDEASNWGQVVADKFVTWLFETDGTADNPWAYSWSDGRFAHWIETDPEQLVVAGKLHIPAVSVGQFPNFSEVNAEG